MPNLRPAIACLLLLSSATFAAPYSKTFTAKDTFTNPTDPSPAAQAALDRAKWTPAEFEVISSLPDEGAEAERAKQGGYDALVRFQSPFANGDKLKVVDLGAIEQRDGAELVERPLPPRRQVVPLGQLQALPEPTLRVLEG